MAFDQDPPVTRSLTAAKRAAAGVYDALVEAGILAGETNGAAHDVSDAVDEDEPLFPDNGLDVEA